MPTFNVPCGKAIAREVGDGMLLNDLIHELLLVRRQIPRANRHTAEITIYEHGGEMLVTCDYMRENTPAEIAKQAEADAERERRLYIQEYQHFLALQAKFAKKPDET